MDVPLTTFRVDITIDSLADLDRLAGRLAELLRPGGVVLLEGSLGVGKTTLAKAIGRALGIRSGMSSPTFDLLHVHAIDGLIVYHGDGYRLQDVGEWDVLDLPAPDETGTLLLIEWGEAIGPQYPERLEIRFERDGERRRIRLCGVGPRMAERLRVWATKDGHDGV